ncbi:DNA-processing protein DprA [Frigoribacterium sp. CG_9.8]|uniref:DNA-processing protein DprA n=1 Tax=Frigoribacterium sp. CG_9.8 TaxID=2787733 RepID=UPI0018C9EB14|nr:DNA-processing protein DprA [Frigoribacterium sp. CG_9.8]MBG6109083.1 DNA processing protein [Frigoribacterium sp. CG_9.8]
MTINALSPSMGTTLCLLDDDTIARIALAGAGVSGDPGVAIGVDTLGGPVAFVAAVHDGEDRAAPLSNLVRQRIRAFATPSRVGDVLQSMTCNHVCAVTPWHDQWPTQLDALDRIAPLVLFTQGDVDVLGRPSVAITGTTEPTVEAVHMTIELTTGLADRRWVIAASTSHGVDQLALRAAAAMGGETITVAAMGLRGLNVGRGSVAISELPPTPTVTVRGQRRAKYLLAAITTKTIIVEAGVSSGALRTAEAAQAMNRPVGVAAGTNGNPPTAGCLELLELLERHSVAIVSSITDADRLQ